MSRSQAIHFQFQDANSAFSAYEMLEELGYDLRFRGTTHTDIEIVIERSDLTSALEIAQAHGGLLDGEVASASHVYKQAYGLHEIRIPEEKPYFAD